MSQKSAVPPANHYTHVVKKKTQACTQFYTTAYTLVCLTKEENLPNPVPLTTLQTCSALLCFALLIICFDFQPLNQLQLNYPPLPPPAHVLHNMMCVRMYVCVCGFLQLTPTSLPQAYEHRHVSTASKDNCEQQIISEWL